MFLSKGHRDNTSSCDSTVTFKVGVFQAAMGSIKWALFQRFIGVPGLLLLCAEWAVGTRGKQSKNAETTQLVCSWSWSRILTLPLSLRTVFYSSTNSRECQRCVRHQAGCWGDSHEHDPRIRAMMELIL